MANKHIKICSSSLVIREMQTKNHSTTPTMAKIKDNIKCWQMLDVR